MSDVPDGSGQYRRTRSAEGGAPVGGALAIVLAAIAVVAGFFILNTIGGDGDGGLDFAAGDDSQSAASSADESGTTTTIGNLPPATTEPPVVVEGASVIVANANGQGGTAGAMSDALALGPGFTMVTPTNSSASTPDLDTSAIYYDGTVPAAKSVAESVARALGGGVTVAPLSGTPPTQDGTLGGADVLLMLGKDKANKTLAELNPETPAAPSPAAPADSTTTVAG